jgi:hypothetical protein
LGKWLLTACHPKFTGESFNKKRVFKLLLGVFPLLSMIPVDRAEASTTVTLLSQNYTGSATICNADSSQCDSTGNLQTSSPPVRGDAAVPNPTGTISVEFLSSGGSIPPGGTDLSSGFIFSAVSVDLSQQKVFDFPGFVLGITVATMEFSVNTASEISLSCNILRGLADLADVTTSQSLFVCFSPPDDLHGQIDSGTASLNTRDTYLLTALAIANSFAGAADQLIFQVMPEMPAPEPATFRLLGMALISLGLVRKRLEKGKERQAIR